MLAPTLLAVLAAPADDPPVSTFTSPSRAWVLTVTRPERTWNGDVELVLTHEGVETWRARHELGLREACVGDDGRVAGYGYTGEDHDGYPGNEPDWPKGEYLRVFALDAEGALSIDEAHRRGPSPGPDMDPSPQVLGAFMVPDLGRFVVRVHDEDVNRGAESWLIYDLASNVRLSHERPRLVLDHEKAVRGPAAVRPVPGTGLLLLHWTRSAWEPRARGSVFQLVDAELRAVWTLELPHEFDAFGAREQSEWWDRGSLHSTSDHAFELRLAADAVIVRYTVEREDDGWRVTETDRRPDPHALPKPKAKPKPRPR